jgi:geranylgeranyl pyrophosphate synthase
MGLQAARQHAHELHEQALQALVASALPDTQRLRELADLVVHRQH